MSEGFLVVVPNSHPLACRVAVSVSDLANEPLIMTRGRPGGVFLPGLQDVLTQIGAESRIVQQTPEYVSSINLVAAGFGVTVTPAVLRGMRGDAVTYLTLETDPPLRTHVAIVSWRGDTSPSALNFLALSMQTAEA